MTFKSAEPTVLIEQKMRSPQAFARSVGCGTQPTGEVIFRRNLRAYIPENSVFGGARSIPTAFGFLVSRRVNNHRDACAQVFISHLLLFYFVRVGSVHFYMRRTRNSSGWKRFGGSFFLRERPRKTLMIDTAKQCTEVHCFRINSTNSFV